MHARHCLEPLMLFVGGPCDPRYGTLLLVDAEDEYTEEAISHLSSHVAAGLSLVVLADWCVLCTRQVTVCLGSRGGN